jgi:alkylhydroperoxidase family enzyme
LARRLKVPDEQIDAVARDDLSVFDPAWRAALAFANDVTRFGGVVADERFRELAEHFSTEQIVEVTAVIALFNYFNRFANGLNIPVTL